MPDTLTHPSPEKLAAYGLGQLPPDQATLVEQHVTECETCCETIFDLSSSDTFVDLLYKAKHAPTEQTVDRYGQVISQNSVEIPEQLVEHPRYEIVGLIGKGGMGDVYKARHRKMDRAVALKVINRELVRKSEAVDRFHREVKTAAQLSHPNIVTAHDADNAGDYHFMVMEYVDGVDLSRIIKDRGELPAAEACNYICQAAIGLQHAHEQGMVHRDIKPHNLMLTTDGTVKILDFGLAALAPNALSNAKATEGRSDLTAVGAIMGTPDFISPEQASDARGADIRSDIYSLGATFYYLLSGRPMFADGSVMEKLKGHAQFEPEPLNSLRDDVPADLAIIISKMIAKDPEERFQTPVEVADALSKFKDVVAGGPVSASTEVEKARPAFVALTLRRVLPLLAVAITTVFALGLLSVKGCGDSAQETQNAYTDLSSYLQTGKKTKHNTYSVNALNVLTDSSEGRKLLAKIDADSEEFSFANFEVGGAKHAIDWAAALIHDDRVTPRQRELTVTVQHESGSYGPVGSAPSQFHLESVRITKGGGFSGPKLVIGFAASDRPKDRQVVQETFQLKPGKRYEVDVDLVDVIDGSIDWIDLWRNGKEKAGDGQPATASTSPGKPELKITGKTVTKGTAGLPSLYDWDFKGRDVGDLKVRLLLAQNGKTEIIQEFDFEELPTEFANKVRLEVKDPGTGADRKRRVNATLYVECPVPSHSTSLNEDKGLSISVVAPFSNKIERANLTPIEPGQSELLLALSFWKGDMTHDQSMESMTEATKGGNATFLFVTLDWSPVSPDVTASAGDPGTSPDDKPVNECAAIQAALREYYMDKHPLFVASVNHRTKILSDLRKLGDMETRRQIGELAINSPVSEVINSFPGKPYVTFTEVTRASGDEVSVVSVNLYRNANGTCRFEVTQKERKKLAGETIANGKPITEEEVRKLVRRIAKDSAGARIEGFLKAKDAYVRAKRLEQSGDIEKAADAYLEAYREDPTLLAYEQFATIKKAKRLREFVEVFNAERLLLVPLTGNPVERIAKDLMSDRVTRLDGRAVLDQMWEARPNDQWPLLGNPPDDAVFQIGEPLLEIRKQPYKNEKRPPTDPDWGRFRANSTYEAIGRNRGLLQKLTPQLKDTVEQKIYLAKTIREVEQTIEQDPNWKAGVAVLAFLEAELGNEQRAVELIETVLADTENPITCSAAMTFGQALEGKTAALDQLVIRLYEKSVGQWGEFELGEPEYSLNLSPIQNLAGLYAKYGRREEARRLLLRLTIPEGVGVGGSKNKFVTCPPGRVLLDYSDSGPEDLYPKVRTEDQVPDSNCMACHRKERNLFSYLTMSDKLTDLGYPVDARLSLARIDASFGNSYSSDDDWRQAKTPRLYCTSEFQPVSEKVDRAITPQAVLEALESGAFNDIDFTKPVIAKNATGIDLMLSVRGEYGKSTVFSSVVDLLELAVNSKGDEAAVTIVQIDQLLADEFAKHPENVEAGIAATVCAFLRGDFEAAQTRSQKLNERVAATKPEQSDVALWLVARLALDNEKTEAIGESLTKRALAAAEKSADPLFKEAIVREREVIARIVTLRRLSAAKDAPAPEQKDLIDTAAAGEIFNTLLAAVKAAGLTHTLAESGPFTILAPTDEAFSKLPQQALKDLLKPENKDKLARILKYHVIPGRIPASDVQQAESLVTLIGEPVYIAKQKGRLTANKANVIAADLAASNGFIHVIDEVLIPRGRTLLSQYHDVVEYDWAGNKTWEVKLELPHESWGLPTGERVVEHIPVDTGNVKDDFGTLRELIVYAAGDGPPRKLWSIPSSLLGATLLPNGQILVWTDEVIRRYDRSGRKLRETEIVWKGQKRLPLGAEPLPNGNLRVLFRTSTETYKTRPDTAVEINEQGRVIRELPYDPNIKLLQRLPNGNSLVRIGEDYKSSLIEERDANDKRIWAYTNDKLVLTAQRLPNGDTLIGAIGQAKAIDTSGNVTWQLDESLRETDVGFESYRYYPVLVPENRSSN